MHVFFLFGPFLLFSAHSPHDNNAYTGFLAFWTAWNEHLPKAETAFFSLCPQKKRKQGAQMHLYTVCWPPSFSFIHFATYICKADFPICQHNLSSHRLTVLLSCCCYSWWCVFSFPSLLYNNSLISFPYLLFLSLQTLVGSRNHRLRLRRMVSNRSRVEIIENYSSK